MKSSLLLIVFSTLVQAVFFSRAESFGKIAAENDEYIDKLQRRESQELRCLSNIDEVVASKWNAELNKIPTNDLGKIETVWGNGQPSKSMYNTVLQEWLMDNGQPGKIIDGCFRPIVNNVASQLKESDVKCLNKLFADHLKLEDKYKNEFDELLNNSTREQLPFRRFISFREFVELMFQNRNPDALEPLERTVYEHAEGYLAIERDRDDKIYIMEQECEWKNARALREAPNVEAMYREFGAQVRRSVSQQVANALTLNWNLNVTLPKTKYELWLKSRKDMETKLNKEIGELRDKKSSAQTLCEYATKLAYRFSDEQSAILLPEDKYYATTVKTKDIATKARSIESALKKRGDVRRTSMDELAKKIEDDARCLTAFRDLVENHQKFAVASAFIDARYTYPEVFCKRKNLNLGLIGTIFCKCIGSFCVAHPLAALFAEEYAMKKGPGGIYKIVRSGIKSGKKKTW